MKRILYCDACKTYTLHETCSCGAKTRIIIPAKYSPEDPYGKYRRQAKAEV